jgi:hypothetical protein
VSLIPDQCPVKQLAAAALHRAFHDRVHARHLDAGEYDGDPGRGEDGVEQRRELAVSIADEVRRPRAAVFEVHDEVAHGLGHPSGGRVGGGAQDPHSTAGVFDDGEDVYPRTGQGDRLDEVTRQQCLCLRPEEGGPGAGRPVGGGVDAGVVEDLPDGGGGDLDAEDEQLAVHASVTPAGVLRGQTRVPQMVSTRPPVIGC